jgi:ACT domain-containing protein
MYKIHNDPDQMYIIFSCLKMNPILATFLSNIAFHNFAVLTIEQEGGVDHPASWNINRGRPQLVHQTISAAVHPV